MRADGDALRSVFAFFCMSMLKYEKTQVGLLLSAMGIGGMLVQGVLVRITVRCAPSQH